MHVAPSEGHAMPGAVMKYLFPAQHRRALPIASITGTNSKTTIVARSRISIN
jgi:UDP-N-acetylmuramyl tripeptide synthase